jgi:hypothetical protein
MGNKRSRPGSKGTSSQGDDFRAINGVSTAVEARLHRAGILTYAQFASLSPEDIMTIVGNISGLTVEKIIKQNWIAQARELALRMTLEDTIEDEAPDENSLHHEKFEVDVLISPDKTVTHTRVTHTQTGEVDQWDGWHEQRLITFFARQANLSDLVTKAAPGENLLPLPAVQIEESKSKPDPHLTIEPPGIEASTTGAAINKEEAASQIVSRARSFQEPRQRTSPVVPDVQSHKFEVLTTAPDPSTRLLSHDQPFDVRLTLDLTDLAATREKPLFYSAVFHARSLSGESTQTYQRVNGKIEQRERPVIVLKGIYLIPGSYSLDAAVNIKMPNKAPISQNSLKINVSGGFLQVY